MYQSYRLTITFDDVSLYMPYSIHSHATSFKRLFKSKTQKAQISKKGTLLWHKISSKSLKVTSSFASSFEGIRISSGSGAFSSVSSMAVTPVPGRDLVPPRSRADFGLCLHQYKTNVWLNFDNVCRLTLNLHSG